MAYPRRHNVNDNSNIKDNNNHNIRNKDNHNNIKSSNHTKKNRQK